MHTPKSPARKPDFDSRAGITTDSVVPGTTVLLTTTSCRGRRRRPPETANDALSICDVSSEPSLREGVPTHKKITSASLVALAVSIVALRWCVRTSVAISRSSPFSKTGDLPWESVFTFDTSESTQVTELPFFASATAVPSPAYPAPMTTTRANVGAHRLPWVITLCKAL